MNEHPRGVEPAHLPDELEPLFGVAGRRPKMPAHELEPIRDAARRAWRRQLQRAARRRAAWLAAGVAAAVLLAIGLRGRAPVPLELAPSTRLGEMLVQTGAVAVAGTPGAASGLHAGSTVATGPDGRAALRLAGGTSVRIDVASSLRLESATLFALERGAVYVDSNPRAGHDAIAVATPFGTVRHLGTQFEARLLDGGAESDGSPAALRVTVREGLLEVGRGEQRHRADAGTELILRADGSIERNAASAEGVLWGWTQRAAPPFEIEGRTLAAFLDWTSREIGLPWQYADDGLERLATETLLHGSIAGLTPEESLAVVLPGCGVRHRRGERALVLELQSPR